MQWMALGNLWFALIIPAIIVLYLLKRKVEDRVIPSTLLWQRTLQNWEAVRPWEKLRRNLLLILQLLIACLFLLALLRPAVPTDGISNDHTVLVVDTSGSMLAREGEVTRMERAVSTAQGLVEQLGSGQTMTLIEAGREPNVLLSKSDDKQALTNELQALSAFPGAADANAAYSLAGAIAANEPGSGVVWIGDGSGERKLETGAASSFQGPFRFMQMGRTRENTAIGVFVTQPAAKGVEGLLRLDHYGSQPTRGTITIFDGENKLLDTDSFSMDAGGSYTASFQALPVAPVYRAVIEPEQDGLAEDNEMWSVPFAAGKGKAVLLSPDGNRFLHQALQTVGNMDVETIQQAPQQKAGARDLWIYDGIVPDTLPDANVLLLAPDRKTNWLPLQGKRELEQQPKAVAQDDALLKYVDWRDVHIAASAELDEMPGMITLVRAGETDLVRAGVIDGRRVVIIGFDLHESDLPLRPAFPILMQNIVTWLSPTRSAPIGSAHPGEVLSIPLTPGASERTMTYPNGQKTSITGEGTTWMMQVPDELGLYRLDEVIGSGQQSRYFAVQMSETESDIMPKAQRMGMEPQAGQLEGGEKAASSAGAMELTHWLAALALLVLCVEWRVYQRGY
ncbi:BatA and WFA domain-containing protein [uncultured Brevibacillus sp.]|uniref:vWA domain-containing protein n=1 Tax=uncultured Brevibacillus sp. TaxID=169970 RepID=UPI0025987F12|nr:BatA and WFA domain-containing protein [uncultured Brevibacillus sp.]